MRNSILAAQMANGFNGVILSNDKLHFCTRVGGKVSVMVGGSFSFHVAEYLLIFRGKNPLQIGMRPCELVYCHWWQIYVENYNLLSFSITALQYIDFRKQLVECG